MPKRNNKTKTKNQETKDRLLTLLATDEASFTRELAATHPADLSKHLEALIPKLQANPDLVEFLRERLPHSHNWIGRANLKTIEEWLPRTIISDKRRSISQIAMSIAREHDPTFPEFAGHFDSPLAKQTKRSIREGSENTQELIQNGRGWRWFNTYYDSGPGEISTHSERIATAVHPAWVLKVYSVEDTGCEEIRWSSFTRFEEYPDSEVEILGMAQVTHASGQGLMAQLIAGEILPEHNIRLCRDGNVRWQGKFEKFTLNKGQELPLPEGGTFGGLLNTHFNIEEGDTIESISSPITKLTP